MAEPFVNLTLSFWSSNTTSQSRTVQDAPNGQPGPSILNKVISGFISDRDSSSKNLVSSMDDVDFFYDNDTDSSNTYYGPLFSQLSIVSSNVLENVTVELSRVLRDNSTNEPAWTQCWPQINGTSLDCLTGINATKGTAILTNGTADEALDRPDKVYWALLLIVLPFLAVFGNSLVILSVYKERSLQSVTNYFIVSLACADLLVASVVMPFAVYFLLQTQLGTSLHINGPNMASP
ncbi:Dopamine D2-like receptor [Halotydeus destructor]|nr:Dopamine D2-like receptor [Halotydeus destructor]